MGNEITLKIKGSMEEFCKRLEELNFKIHNKFIVDDIYFIPENLELKGKSIREILKNAVLLRNIEEFMPDKKIYKLTFKEKEFDENGNILRQEKHECEVLNLENTQNFIQAIGYKKLMRIVENGTVYIKDDFSILTKDVVNGENLIEIETNEKFDCIEKLIKKLEEYNLPIFTDNYFVKKAEIELEKVLKY